MRIKNVGILNLVLLCPLFMSLLMGNFMLAIEIFVIGILLWIEIE
jgi:hypothetical protein